MIIHPLLDPCPVCGGCAMVCQIGDKWQAYCFCEFGLCRAYVYYHVKNDTEAEAIAEWNEMGRKQRAMMAKGKGSLETQPALF